MARDEMRYKPGSGFYVGVPARDLSAEEVARFGREFLLSLGLYEEIDEPKPRRVAELEQPDKTHIEEVDNNARD